MLLSTERTEENHKTPKVTQILGTSGISEKQPVHIKWFSVTTPWQVLTMQTGNEPQIQGTSAKLINMKSQAADCGVGVVHQLQRLGMELSTLP
jgi:hypothetical protein